MPLSAFAPVAALDHISLISLQKRPAQNAIAEYFNGAPLLNLGAEIADFADTMAIIETLDLVITVDTAVAHQRVRLANLCGFASLCTGLALAARLEATAPGTQARDCFASLVPAIGKTWHARWPKRFRN